MRQARIRNIRPIVLSVIFVCLLFLQAAGAQANLIWQLGAPTYQDLSLNDFLVLGPFSTDGKIGSESFAKDYIDPTVRPKEGDKIGNLSWKRCKTDTGKLNLLDTVGYLDDSVAYVYCEVSIPEEREILLQVGSDDGFRCWLNGKEVLKSKDEARAYIPGQDSAPVHLKSGVNSLMFKVVQYKGAWMLGATLTPVVGSQAKFLNVGPDTELSEDVLNLPTHTYTYRIDKPGLQTTARIPANLTFVVSDKGTVRGEKHGGFGPDFRPNALAVEWQEERSGWRELEIHSEHFKKDINQHWKEHCIADNYGDDVRVELPGGQLALFQIPLTSANAPTDFLRGKGDVNWHCRFPVSAGRNHLVIRAVSTGWNEFYFDYVKLNDVEPGSLVKPVLEFGTDKLANIFLDGEDVVLTGSVYNLTVPVSLNYSIKDYFGNILEEKKIALSPAQAGPAKIDIRPRVKGRGYFEMRSWLTDSQGKVIGLEQCLDKPITPFAVIVPPRTAGEADWNARFGAQTADYPVGHEAEYVYQLLNMQYLIGTKWERAPIIWWFYLESQRDDFNWQAYDERVKFLTRKGFRLMPILWTTPNWAKAVKKDTATWEERYEVPDMEAWGHYTKELFTHYKDDVRYWEIINEPMDWFGKYNSKAYAEGLKVVGRMRDLVDPGIKIVSGMRGDRGRALTFTKEWMADVGPESYDVANVHYMGGQPETWKLQQSLWGNLKQPVWDTENHFNSAGTLENQAAELVRDVTTEFSWGIQKFFFHGGVRLMGRPHRILTVTPAMVSHSMLVNRLDLTTHLCDLAPDSGVEGHAFKRSDGGTVLVLWNNDGLSRSFKDWWGADLGAAGTFGSMERDVYLSVGSTKPILVDLMNNEKSLTVKDGKIHLVIGNTPVLLEGVDQQELLKASILSVKPGQVALASGEDHSFSLKVNNPLSETINGRLEFVLPAGWQVKREPKEFTLDAGTSQDFPFSLITPKDRDRSLAKLKVRAELTSNSTGMRHSETEFDVTTSPSQPGVNLIAGANPDRITEILKPENGTKALVSQGILAFDNGGGRVTSIPIGVFAGESYAFGLNFKCRTPISLSLAQYDGKGELIGRTKSLLVVKSEDWNRDFGMYCVPEGVVKVALVVNSDGPAEISSPTLLLREPVNDKAKLKWRAEAIRVNEPLPVDGDLARWARIPAIEVDRLSQVRRAAISGAIYDAAPFPGWAGPSDCSGGAKIAWDDRYLYLTLRTYDDVIVKPRSGLTDKDARQGYGSALFASGYCDLVQLCFDPLSGEGGSDNNRYSGHFLLSFAGPYILLELRDGDPDEPTIWSPAFKTRFLQNDPDVKHYQAYLADGVIYQAAIPLDKLPGMKNITANKEMGFEWRIWEVDKDKTQLRGFMTWTESQSSGFFDWAGTQGLGIIKFGE